MGGNDSHVGTKQIDWSRVHERDVGLTVVMWITVSPHHSLYPVYSVVCLDEIFNFAKFFVKCGSLLSHRCVAAQGSSALRMVPPQSTPSDASLLDAAPPFACRRRCLARRRRCPRGGCPSRTSVLAKRRRRSVLPCRSGHRSAHGLFLPRARTSHFRSDNAMSIDWWSKVAALLLVVAVARTSTRAVRRIYIQVYGCGYMRQAVHRCVFHLRYRRL